MQNIDQNPQISVRTLAKDRKKECDLDVSHETVRHGIIRHRSLQEFHERNAENRFTFSDISQRAKHWKNIIFCDETIVILYSINAPFLLWRKTLTTLATFVKLSVRFGVNL